MPRRPANSQMDSVQKRHKAVTQARDILAEKVANCTKATVQHLVDPGVLQDILHDLDATRVPHPSGGRQLSQQNIELAIGALRDLSFILLALNAEIFRDPALQVVMDEYLSLLHVGWCDITAWIILLIRWGPSSGIRWADILLHAADILEVVVGQPEENRSKQIIISLPSTIDILFLILSLIDPGNGKPASFCTKFAPICFISRVFATCANQEDVRASITSRLAYLGRTQRRRFVSSLLLRVQDVAEHGNIVDISAAAGTLFNLLGGAVALMFTDSLKEDFQRADFVLEVTRSIKALVEKGAILKVREETFWLHMSRCIVYLVTLATAHQARKLPYKAIAGGIFPCLFYALPRAKDLSLPDSLHEYARHMLHFMTDSRGYRAASAVGGLEALAIYTEGVPVSQESKYVYEVYSSAFRQASLAFDSGFNAVPVCCSMKHKSPPIALDAVKGLRRCARCRFFFYCSENCQKEDWTSFHSKECEEIYKEYREIECSLTPRLIHDKLVYLQSVANSCLPSLGELQRQQQAKQGSIESSICLFDLKTDNVQGNGTSTRLDFSVSNYFEVTKHVTLWQTYGRIQSLVSDMEANKPSIALVEGLFTIDSNTVLSVSTTMQYSSHEELRYEVKNTVLRLMILPRQ